MVYPASERQRGTAVHGHYGPAHASPHDGSSLRNCRHRASATNGRCRGDHVGCQEYVILWSPN